LKKGEKLRKIEISRDKLTKIGKNEAKSGLIKLVKVSI